MNIENNIKEFRELIDVIVKVRDNPAIKTLRKKIMIVI